MADRIINVFGLRRSGNHAIINWLMRQASNNKNVEFYNDCKLNRNPQRAKTYEFKPKHLYNKEKVIIVSYEDHDPVDIEHYTNKQYFKNIDYEQNVIILRDFRNMWASRDASEFSRKNSYESKVLRYWKDYAKFGLTDDFTVICYDLWLKDPIYRKAKSKELNLHESAGTIGKVSGFGGGSTFDGMKHIDNPMEMKLLERYKSIEHKPVYQEYMKDKELNKLLYEYEFKKR